MNSIRDAIFKRRRIQNSQFSLPGLSFVTAEIAICLAVIWWIILGGDLDGRRKERKCEKNGVELHERFEWDCDGVIWLD